MIAVCICASGVALCDNWIENGDFEADAPMLWQGASIQGEVVHSGRGALRLDESADKASISARYGDGIEVNQTEPDTIMAALWLRLDAVRQTGPIRGGVTFHVEMADGSMLAWYGGFELDPSEMGSWVYREDRWKPRAPIVKIRPAVYLRGCEGSIYVDDIYLGPPIELPTPPRTTIPLAVTGSNGRFTGWPQFSFLDFRPAAHVFHLAGKNEANLELTCDIEVGKPAPIYLTSAWGSQYWTLYCPQRRELVQIFTDERLDLSQAGQHTVPVRMCGFSDRASDLAAGGYVFITEATKSFLIYSTEKPAGEAYPDARTGKTFSYWDGVKIERLSRGLGASGVVAPFSVADLSSYRLSVAAHAFGQQVTVRPVLTDAQGAEVPLYGLELRGEAAGKMLDLSPQVDADGVPTGTYAGAFAGGKPEQMRVSGVVRLACPTGTKGERINEQVKVFTLAPAPPRPLPGLDLIGWGYATYELSPKASHGPDSMKRLVSDAKAAGVSKLLVHARSSTETLYPSSIAPAGTVGEWDVLRAAVEDGKRQGVDIYAAYILGIAQKADLEAHPDWAAVGRDGKSSGWYCYNNPEVRAYHGALMSEIVRQYDVGGIALDFCRPGGGCFCSRCAAAFEAKYGKPLKDVDAYDADWVNWQRDCITEYMRELRAAIRKARADAKFSGYVWGRLAADADRAGQDFARWLREGIMDFVAVGIYTPSSPQFRAQCHVLREIAERDLAGHTEGIYPLLGVGYIQRANPSHAEADAVINRHLRAAREEGLQGAGYFAFYSIRTHLETSGAHSAATEP